jgi:predicted TIM-barrel enzyme
MAGRGSLAGLLPYGDANQIVVDMGREVLPVVKNTPVLAGVCGTDQFRVMEVYLKQLKEQGFAGVQNFLTVGLIDGVYAHMGTTKGTIGAKTALTLDENVEKVQSIADAGKSVNPDIMVICHGGPIAEPSDVEYVMAKITSVDGFFGASSIERFATEVGIKDQAEAFKNVN